MKTLGRKRGVDVTTLGATISLSPELVSKDFTETKPAETYWRWSTRRGKQVGDEVLTIRFSSPTTIRGVEFDPGNYLTDFPRGLTIQGGDCDGGPTRILSESPSWQGSLSFTPRAYPYLSPRSQVRVFFSQPETVSCIFAHQTGKANFDWSISRVRVIQ
jgi:allantoicase